MTARQFTEVNQHTIHSLKKQGFTSVLLVLLENSNSYRATVEMIPVKNHESELDSISLNSNEIHDYVNGYSPMVEYVIDQKYVNDKIPGPT